MVGSTKIVQNHFIKTVDRQAITYIHTRWLYRLRLLSFSCAW